MAQAVKSRATVLARRLHTRRLAAWAWISGTLVLALPTAPEALGQSTPPGRIARPARAGGAASGQPAEPTDPSLLPRAPTRVRRRCALGRPVCVEGGDPEVQTAALRLFVDAYEVTVLGNQGPAWSLEPTAEPMTWLLEPGPLEFRVEPAWSTGFDRGRVRCRGGELTRSTAVACAAGSSLGRVAPNTAPALQQGFAAYLALLHDAAPTTALALSEAAISPERGLLSDPVGPTAALLVERIAALGTPVPGVTAPWLAFVLAATSTRPGAPRASTEPDLFDVLNTTLGTADPHLARFLDELSVLRWGDVGPLGMPTQAPEPAWAIDAASLPRNLVLPQPLLPTGGAYVVLTLDEATRKSGLALRTFCEGGSRYAWSMGRLDDQGRLQTRVLVAQRGSDTSAEGVLRQLERTHKALIVGTSLGGGPGVTLDPDETPLPAHACRVALDRLPAR